ncbi:unnamed protein product [Pleuronectes platessa]|uniref:Uncharacterized protein n=1 Tax=Pleuronectes platessa TaxID=8262 RepID=A0A9N7YV05_PLEPL|nr:unnamed protein product [Pleuronectes platessa]
MLIPPPATTTIRTWAINRHKRHEWKAGALYPANKRGSTPGAEGTGVEKKAEPEEVHVTGEDRQSLTAEGRGIICHVFMDISACKPMPHILWQRSSHHCPNSMLWTGEMSHVMFLPRSRSNGTK